MQKIEYSCLDEYIKHKDEMYRNLFEENVVQQKKDGTIVVTWKRI